MGQNNRKILCPTCGNKPIKTETKYGLRLSCCGMWAWGNHPLVDAETHNARKLAHTVFDQIWKSGRASRSQCYAALATALNIEPRDCHMKLMDKETAMQTVSIVHQWNRNA